MLDTQERSPSSPPEKTRNGVDAPESVEALEEALATARLRLQERLAGEIEAQRHDLERLEAEHQQRHTEINAMVAQANETAARVLREANEASEQVRREANDAAERTRREANEAAERTTHEATEASDRAMKEASDVAELKLYEAAEAAERMLREANENARATLSHANETATALLTRMRDQAGSFMSVAAEEVERVEKAIAATRPARGSKSAAAPQASNVKATRAEREKPDSAPETRKASATSETEQAASGEKEGPSRWIRSPWKGRAAGQSGTAEGEASPPAEAAAPADEPSRPVTGATEPSIEAVVTRMVVHPLVGATTRTHIKDRFEALPDIQAVKLGPTGEDSFELLVIHPRESRVLENVLAIAPSEILLREQKVGYMELELKDLGWVEEGA